MSEQNIHSAATKPCIPEITAVDLFCGAGGLTRGLLDSGVRVVAGYDIESACQFSYENNNDGAKFISKSVSDVSVEELNALYPSGTVKVLVGCAPCQPFSKYTQGKDKKDDSKWGLLFEFLRLIDGLRPAVVSMENVTEIQKHSVFNTFVSNLNELGYHVDFKEVYCPSFGVPQQRKRLVLLASLLGNISLIEPNVHLHKEATVRNAIGSLPKLYAGETSTHDRLHRSSRLSELNLKRIKISRPGGNWRDWPDELIAQCHKEDSGKTYPSVYGRMEWDKPSPTITTQFFGFGNGRFGHPEQDRALSLREGAILQSFPIHYDFVEKDKNVSFSVLGKMIGNAVPVKLGEAIGDSIISHVKNKWRL